MRTKFQTLKIFLFHLTLFVPCLSYGAEVPITGLSGFFDWQSNGICMRQLYVNPGIIHAIYMTSSDSLNIDSSRKVHYSCSTDGGVNWLHLSTVPTNPAIRSGYGYLTTFGPSSFSHESAIIVNHYGSPIHTYIHTDAFPGLGSFTTTPSFSAVKYLYPTANRMSNDNILVTGLSTEGRDTIVSQIYSSELNQWIGSPVLFHSNNDIYYLARVTTATGPGGKALVVASALYDIGGSFGKNRIFYWTTGNNGLSWSERKLLFNTQIDSDGDTSRPFVGLDAVYDSVGNFFVAFNTVTDKEDYTNSKIWLNKNGVQNRILVRNTDIPGAMVTAAGIPMEGVCSMDWPSISISEYNDAVFCSYSVAKQNDIVNGFNSMDIYISYANAGNLEPSIPFQMTSGLSDERYVSLNRTSFGSLNRKIPAVYQKDPQPGTSAPTNIDNAPLSRSSLIYNEFDLIFGILNSIETGESAPSSYTLKQNYPNPFNPATNIKFEIPKSGNVRVAIYDISGKLVAMVVNKNLTPGTYETQWDGSGSSSGVYFYSLEAEGFKETRKMLLIK
jgi:hypothetical protein